jgi:DNA-binding GntR family transcriptional regulator
VKLDRIEPTNLRARAALAIRANITTGQMRQGELYSVGHVAEGLGVSPTPVREALFDLAGEGLIEIVRNRGFRVPVLSDHDLDEIFELRQLIEVPTLSRLTGKLGKADIVAARRQIEQIEAAARRGDLTAFLEGDRRYHTHLLSLGGNRRLVEVVTRLRDATRLNGLVHLKGSPELVASAKEHGLLLDALIDGDRKKVADLMSRHLHHTRGIWAGRDELEESTGEVFQGSNGRARSVATEDATRIVSNRARVTRRGS